MNTLKRVFPWLLLAPVLLPVVIYNGVIYPYLVPKTLSFYAVSLVTAAVFLVLVASGEAFYWARLNRKEIWIPLALLAVAYVTSSLGLGFYHSFWSIFDRGDGLLMLTCATADFYLLLLYADRAFFTRLLRAVAVVASLVALYGIGEWLVTGGRIGSFLGNAAFFAGYLGIALFATVAAAGGLTKGWRRSAYAGAALQVVAIVLTATRGTMLALFVVFFLVLVHEAVRGVGKRRARAFGVLATLAVAGILFIAFRGEIAKVPFSPVQRVATASFASPDIASRLFIWRHMLGEIAQRPLIGVGAEHIDYLFNKFYNPSQIQEQWFDRSHNAFLDYAAQYGVLGFALYVLLIASFFVAARRFVKKGDQRTAATLMLLAIVYAVQNFFVFDTITSFWLLLALLATALAASLDESPAVAHVFPSWVKGASLVAALGLVALIVPVSVRPAIAAYDLAHAYGYQLSDVQKSIEYLHNGFALDTYGNLEYGYEAYAMYADVQSKQLSGDKLTAAYQEAEGILAQEFARTPYDARTALDYADLLSMAPSGVTVDKTKLSDAIARAISLSPKRAQSWYILVNTMLTHANSYPVGSAERTSGYVAAEDILNRYIALVPGLAEPYYVLAQLDLATGDTAGALAEAAQGKRYYTSDLPTAERAASFYESVQDWPNASYFLAQVVQLDPGNVAAQYDLAKAEYLNGNKAQAEAIVVQLRKTNPAILQTDQAFLNAITQYEQSAGSAKQ